MLTTTAAGRTWDFSHAIGRNAGLGNGFTQPNAIALAPGGLIYVSSRGGEGAGGVVAPSKRIGKLTMDEEFLGDFGKGETVWASSLAVAKDGNLYCADEYLNAILIFSPDGEKLTQWGEAGSDEGQIDGPSGIAFDADDNLYVVDSRNGRVEKFTSDGRFMLAWGEPGDGDGQFDRPWGITVDGDGNVYVVDWGNDRVQKFSSDGQFLMSVPKPGESGADLNRPADVAVDSEGDIYVTDWGNNRVQIYDPDGSIITSLYGDATVFSKWAQEVVDSNPDVVKAYRRVRDLTPLGKFARPLGIAVDEEDRIIVTEMTRGRLQVYAKDKDYMDPQFNL